MILQAKKRQLIAKKATNHRFKLLRSFFHAL